MQTWKLQSYRLKHLLHKYSFMISEAIHINAISFIKLLISIFLLFLINALHQYYGKNETK